MCLEIYGIDRSATARDQAVPLIVVRISRRALSSSACCILHARMDRDDRSCSRVHALCVFAPFCAPLAWHDRDRARNWRRRRHEEVEGVGFATDALADEGVAGRFLPSDCHCQRPTSGSHRVLSRYPVGGASATDDKLIYGCDDCRVSNDASDKDAQFAFRTQSTPHTSTWKKIEAFFFWLGHLKPKPLRVSFRRAQQTRPN
jgi:hypothetical protein